MRQPATCLLLLLACLGCSAPTLRAAPDEDPDYLRYVAFEAPGNEHLLLRWPTRKMPLRIYLPRPPEDLFEDPDEVWEAAKNGILAWTDVAGPGLPAFEFVEGAGEADFPIAWAASQPGFAIAHCFLQVDPFQRRFDVAQIVVTGRYRDGRTAPTSLIRDTMLHEVGHALGLGGHSPNPEDLMYGFVDITSDGSGAARGLTARDRVTLQLLYEAPIGTRIRAPRRAY